MITDPLFYRLFETSPETFFLILGLNADSAKAMADRYQYMALEFKETAHRADGVFQPKEAEATTTAKSLVARAKSEIEDAGLRDDLVELIETVVIYKLPRLSREEIQAMLQVHDIRETRVYQEAKEEGFQEGIEKGIEKERQRGRQEKLKSIPKLAARHMSAKEIADILGLNVAVVRKALTKKA